MNDFVLQRKIEIENIIKNRGIRFLVHFTQITNLGSVLDNGLYSIDDIENDIVDAFVNDELRLEGIRNGICLSVSFPNSLMFFSFRQRVQQDWCVLVLDIDLILDKECLFFDTNAANTKFKFINFETLKLPKTFEGMFADQVNNKKDGVLLRNNCGYLLDKDPTDVQAEVICLEHIESRYIEACIFNNNILKEKYENKYKGLEFVSLENCWGVFDSREKARMAGFKGY